MTTAGRIPRPARSVSGRDPWPALAGTHGKPVELTGVAVRHKCEHGSLWVFSLAPATTGVAAELHGLVSTAACGQTVVAKKK